MQLRSYEKQKILDLENILAAHTGEEHGPITQANSILVNQVFQ